MDLRSKFRGSLLGTAVGDSLGRTSEGRSLMDSGEIESLLSRFENLRYTDDTQQMISLTESLVEKGEFDGGYFASRLVDNFEPFRGYGPGARRVIKSLEREEDWREPAKRLFGGEGSYGNGSSMRVAPVGLFCCNDLDNLPTVAEKSSRVTHTHRLGIGGAVLQSAAVALATNEDPSAGLDVGEFIERLRDFANEKEYMQKLNRLEELVSSDPDKGAVVESLGNRVEAFNSVPTAIYSFLSHSRDFLNAVTYAISLGGDADTIGAMTGAIAGAYHGSDSIPEDLKGNLEDKALIISLADDLFEVVEKS